MQNLYPKMPTTLKLRVSSLMPSRILISWKMHSDLLPWPNRIHLPGSSLLIIMEKHVEVWAFIPKTILCDKMQNWAIGWLNLCGAKE